MIRSATLTRWYKNEGDLIRFGEDLFNLCVEDVALSKAAQDVSGPTGTAELASRQLATSDLSIARAVPEWRRTWTFAVRVTSSDTGVLKRIYAREGHRLELGDIIAAATSSEEPFDSDEERVKTAAVFRVTASVNHEIEAETRQPWQERVASTRAEFGRTHIMFCSKENRARQIGIYLQGGRYLNAIFACAPYLRKKIGAESCIFREGRWRDVRGPAVYTTDLLLQSLQESSANFSSSLIQRLKLPQHYFQPRFFAPKFSVQTLAGPAVFPKTVVFFSIVPDLTEKVYRHRQSGLLVVHNPHWIFTKIWPWFQENFEPLGEITPDQFAQNLAEMARLLRLHTNARLIVLNALSTAPRGSLHNYACLKAPSAIRRLEFNLMLVELSRRLDFPILDVDRILKRLGIGRNFRWDYIPAALYPAIGREAFRLMNDLGVFSDRRHRSDSEFARRQTAENDVCCLN